MPQGIAWLLIGPSGTGKTSLEYELTENMPGVNRLISHTTRQPRPGEVERQAYHFVTYQEFIALKEDQALLEENDFPKMRNGFPVPENERSWYGMSRAEVTAKLADADAVMVVEGHGAQQIKSQVECRVIFLLPPPADELARRMKNRGDTDEQIKTRLGSVEAEMIHIELADVVIDSSLPFEEVLSRCRDAILDERIKRRQAIARPELQELQEFARNEPEEPTAPYPNLPPYLEDTAHPIIADLYGAPPLVGPHALPGAYDQWIAREQRRAEDRLELLTGESASMAEFVPDPAPGWYKPDGRPTQQAVHMSNAFIWSLCSSCCRAHVGCVITKVHVNGREQCISHGYNGGGMGQGDNACAHGGSVPGGCEHLHAEDNAGWLCPDAEEKNMYLTMEPCLMCAKKIVTAGGIERVYFGREGYRDRAGVEYLLDAGVSAIYFPPPTGWWEAIARTFAT